MSKYIIEIPDDVQYVLLSGKADNKYYTAVRPIAELEELNSDYINEHYGSLQDEAYKQGYAEAERIWRAPSSDNEFYQKGLGDAWDAARKIAVNMDVHERARVFFQDAEAVTHEEPFKSYTAQEAIDKIKAYEDKRSDRIEVGDEVRAEEGHVFVVTGITDKGSIYGFDKDGMWLVRVKDRLRKTGKHYDIQSILEAMRI